MIAVDEGALKCDLAETYRIYDYKSLPASLVATFSVGLRDDSRIKMKMSGAKAPLNTIILALLTDRIGNLLWGLSEDGRNGVNKPPQLIDVICRTEKEDESDVAVFDSPEAYEQARKKLIEGR